MKTKVNQTCPWGLFTRNGHRLLCSDGKIRACELAQTADTYFSIPARTRVNGKWVSGYATTEESETGERIWCFRHYNCHADKLPEWPACYSEEMPVLLSKAS